MSEIKPPNPLDRKFSDLPKFESGHGRPDLDFLYDLAREFDQAVQGREASLPPFEERGLMRQLVQYPALIMRNRIFDYLEARRERTEKGE